MTDAEFDKALRLVQKEIARREALRTNGTRDSEDMAPVVSSAFELEEEEKTEVQAGEDDEKALTGTHGPDASNEILTFDGLHSSESETTLTLGPLGPFSSESVSTTQSPGALRSEAMTSTPTSSSHPTDNSDQSGESSPSLSIVHNETDAVQPDLQGSQVGPREEAGEGEDHLDPQEDGDDVESRRSPSGVEVVTSRIHDEVSSITTSLNSGPTDSVQR